MSRSTQKSNARLAAVMAFYATELNGEPLTGVKTYVRENIFKELELGKPAKLFLDRRLESLTENVDSYTELLKNHLNKDWPLNRLELVLRIILLLAIDELTVELDTHAAIIIDEYLHIAHAYFNQKEVSFASSILRSLGGKIRTAE